MPAAARSVCRGCLRSVEWNGEKEKHPSGPCPFCGEAVDSRTTEGQTIPGGRPPAPEVVGEAGLSWAEHWDRGTIGTVDRFQLRELLGDGGFGQVYLAFDPRLDRDIALKLLKKENPGERVMQRFFREARAAGRLDHPNIVPVHDAGSDGGRCWIAYEYVSGSVLSKVLEKRRIDLTTAVRITRDLADALDHAHCRGVFHRDVKPDNVLVDERGRPRLIDFGLARRDGVETGLTRTGAVLGTPAYMSPEQASGKSHQADERSDIYSLGVLFHEMLYGRRPSDPKDWSQSGEAERAGPPPSPRPMAPPIPEELAGICRRAMAHDPGARYPDARALVHDLEEWLDRSASPPRRSRLAIGLVIGSLTTALLILGLETVNSPAPVPRSSPAPTLSTGAAHRPVRLPGALPEG